MRRTGYIAILVVLLLGMILIPGANCQNSDGLVWGVTQDQTFRYLIVKTSIYTPPPSISERYLYESHEVIPTIQSLPNIPSVVDNWTEMPRIAMVPYFTNFWIAGVEADVLPVGNWTLLEDLDRSSWLRRYSSQDYIFKNASYFENSTCWGYQHSYNTSGTYEAEEDVSMNCTVIQTKLFSKTDGVLIFRHISLQFYDDNWGTYDFGRIVETAIRMENTPVQNNVVFLLIGGGSVAAIILVVVIYKIKTGKR